MEARETSETIEAAQGASGRAEGVRTVPVTGRVPMAAGTSAGTSAGGVARLLAVGVGGGGLNAINHMITVGVHGVEFYAMNTDAQALQKAGTPNRLRLGEHLTRGLGAGGNPDVGRQAAEESFATIREALRGSDMVFITAGMGGGTGTGASPLIAQAAREEGALAVAVVTTPFAFERKRMRVAREGVEALREVVDALIVVPNARLTELAARDLSAFDAYRLADDVLRQGIQGISDLITVPGLINLDFADIRNIMADAGSAHMSVGIASGEGRAEAAARSAITNPLLEVDISGARGIVFNITGGDDLKMAEVNQIADLITSAAHPTATITFGTVYDPGAKGQVKVTVVATGFEAHVIRQAPISLPTARAQRWQAATGSDRDAGERAERHGDRVAEPAEAVRQPSARPAAVTAGQDDPAPAMRPAAEPRRVDERVPAPSPRQHDDEAEYWQPQHGMPQIGAEAGPPLRGSVARRVMREPGYFGDAFIGSDEPLEGDLVAQRPSILRRIFIGR
jgi:cell division protein FtsZ